MPEILVLRHGETHWNRERRFQGSEDSALTELGRSQAEALGRLLQGCGVTQATHDALTSPQGRARETARIALAPLGLLAAEEPRLVEIGMGAWTGLRRPEIDLRWPGPSREPILSFYARCPEGEPLADVARRAGAVLEGLSRPTVIVTHGITLRLLCALALGRAPEEAEGIHVPQGSLARIVGGRLAVIAPEETGGLPHPAHDGSPAAAGG